MPYIQEFTSQERNLLDKHYSTGLYTDEEWARIIQRIFEDRTREGAIDRAIENSVGSRVGRELAGIERSVRDPRIIGKTFQQYFDEMSEEPGIHATGVAKGLGNILWSTLASPAQILDEVTSGHVEKPLQTAVGALHFLPYLRAGAGIGAVSTAKSLPRVSQALGNFARHPAVAWTSRGLEAADIIVAGEEAGIEALGEGLLEIPGSLGPLVADAIRNRSTRQTDQAHDQATGSKTTAPPDDYQRYFDEAAQATADDLAAGASFDAEAATADLNQRRISDLARTHGAGRQAPTTDEIQAGRRQFWQGAPLDTDPSTDTSREQFWKQNLTPQEQREQFWRQNLSPQEQEQQRDDLANQFQLFETPTSEQREQFWQQNLTPAEQADQNRQQQQQDQSLQEYERDWGEFYRDQAGAYTEGRAMMQEEYEQGIRDPIEFRYNQIAEPLREQYGTATAELHRDADSRLRRLIGEKWYRRYRGRGDRELDERVQRMVKAADQLVEDATDTDTESTSTVQQAMDTIQSGVEDQVGESATITRSGDERTQQITITPNRGQTTPETTSQDNIPELPPEPYTGQIIERLANEHVENTKGLVGDDLIENHEKLLDRIKNAFKQFIHADKDMDLGPWDEVRQRVVQRANEIRQQRASETTPDEQTQQTQTETEQTPGDKALSKIERMRQRREETQTQTETETEDGVITTNEGYRLVPTEFTPTLRDITPTTVPAYKIENADIDFANVVVHQHQNDKGELLEDSQWTASDQDVGATLGANTWGDTPEESASKAVNIVKQIGENRYQVNIQKFREQNNEQIQRSRPLTNEQQKYLEDVLHDRNRWEREGRSGVFKYENGGSITVDTVKGQPDTAVIVGIPGLKPRLVKEVAGRNHEERWQSALYSIGSADFAEETTPAPEEPAPEQTPEPETPAPETPGEKALSKIERMRARRQKSDGELSDVTAEQREIREEYLDLTISDEIEALEAMENLDEFQVEVLDALKDPSTVEKQELRNEYLDLTISDEIEALEAMENLDEFQVEVLDALKAVQQDEPDSSALPAPEDDTFTTQLQNVLSNQGFQNSPPERKLQEAIRLQLESGESLSAPQLFYGASTFFGQGQYNSQQVYDVLEVAVNQYLEAQGLMNVNVDSTTAVDNIDKIQAIEARLPRMSDRTAARDENQQYSTPFHYSYLVNWVANLQPDDVVVEPSAGTGNLAWAAKVIGAEVHVNDIGQFRHHLLQQNFQNVTNVDASNIAQQLPNVNATLVVMNPPFSSTRGQRKNLTLGMNMVESALETLQPGGRLVAIVNGGRDLTPEMRAGEAPGGGPHFNADNYRKIWNRIASKHAVRANLHVSGEVYKEFGTTFNTRLLVIDKYPVVINEPIRNQTDGSLKSEYDTMHKQRVDTIKEAVELLEGVRYERSGEQSSSESTRQTTTETTPGGQSVLPTQPGQSTTPQSDPSGVVPGGDSAVQPGDGTTPPQTNVDRPGTEGTGTTGHGDRSRVEMDDDQTGDTERDGTGTGLQPDSRTDGSEETDAGGVDDGGRSADTNIRTSTQRENTTQLDESESTKQVDAGKSWMPAADSHVIMGKEVSLVETVSLGLIDSPDVANVDVNIAEPAKSRYSNAQMKAIKLNIRAHDAHIEPEILGDAPTRRGMYNGDDTGVGKTWIAAGTIIHYQNQGITKHIVVGADKKWLKDFNEVFTLAGGNADTLFELGSQKNLPASGVMLTTYGTLRGKGQETKRLSQVLEWATGQKPPQSLLSPQTDFELAHFGELPRTFALAVTEYNAGNPMPTRVTDLINEWNGLSQGTGQSIDEIPDSYINSYQDILKEQETLMALEGEVGPAEWMKNAAGYDGTITFDESHNMKNSEGENATNTGIRGRQLQRLLPDGRVTYYSATGTTVIDNIAYMERLGIWGRDKPFANSEDFITDMKNGGLSAQEVMVRDLKAQGLFISRGLDMSDVMVDDLVHELTPVQRQTYNELAHAWQEIRLYLHQYLGSLEVLAEESDGGKGDVGKKKGDIWGEYYSKQLDFFQAVLNAFKMQTVLEDMKKQLDQGKKVSIQFTNTYEESQKRQVDRAEREGIDISEIEFGAREFLEDYLDPETGVFPTYDYEVIYDPVLDKDTLRPVTNSTNQIIEIKYTDARGQQKVERVPPGKPIPNVNNIQNRERILGLVYNSHMPEPPLDQFVQMFKDRGQEIAEITGRESRYYRNEEGERQKEKLSGGDAALRKLVENFNDNELFGLAFSKKGATGANYPATDPNHTIVQYIIQAGWEADTLKQGMGRHKRSNEVAPPEIKNTYTDVIGEKRFASTAAARMAEMGATTRSLAAGGTGLDIFDFDVKYLQTEYGANALYDFFSELNEGYTFTVPGETNPDGTPMVIGMYSSEEAGITGIDVVTGLSIELEQNMVKKDKMPPVKRFLNRVLGSPSIEIQDTLYAEYYRRLQTRLSQAKAENTLDVGVGTLPIKNAEIVNNTVLATDQESGANTYGTIVQADEEVPKINFDELKTMMTADSHSNYWFVEDTEGNVYLDKEVPARVDASTGESKPWVRRTQPDGTNRYGEAENAYGEGWTLQEIRVSVREDGSESWSLGNTENGRNNQLGSTIYDEMIHARSSEEVDAAFKDKWDAKYDETSATKTIYLRMVQGLMLPVWDKINPPIEYPEGTEQYNRELRKRRLVRINLEDGTDIIGRQFASVGEYNQIFENFGVAAPDQSVTVATVPMNQTGVMNMINQDGYTVELTDGLSIRTRQRAGQTYLVVEGDRSRLESLMNDNILDRFRPGGGGWVYSVPNDNITTLFSRHKPVRANKRGDILNINYETPGGTPNVPDENQTGNEQESIPTDPEEANKQQKDKVRERLDAAEVAIRNSISQGWDWINTERMERFSIIDERLSTLSSELIDEWIEASDELTGVKVSRERSERILADNIGSWMAEEKSKQDRILGQEHDQQLTENEHLQALGIDPNNWQIWTAEEREAEVNRIYEALLQREINEEDFNISQAQVQAVNALISGELGDVVNIADTADTQPTEEGWRHAFPKGKAERNKVRAEYTAQVQQIITNETDSKVKVRLRNVNKQLQSGDYFGLHGRTIQSGAEAALIAQFIRNPLIESTLILLRKDNKIVRAEWLSLGQTENTSPGVKAEVERMLADENADDFIRVHNHPSKVAKFSNKDMNTANNWRNHFGTRLAEEIVIDEGTYARSHFDQEGEARFENELQLDLENGTIVQPEFFGAFMKTPKGWTTLMMLDDAGKVVSAMDIQGLYDKGVLQNKLEKILEMTPRATRMHVIAGKGNDGAERILHNNLSNNPVVESMWVEGRPVRLQSPSNRHRVSRESRVAPTDDTIERNIGGTNQRFVKIDPNDLRDVKEKRKPVIIAGITHDLVRDTNREDVSKRTRGDAEHMVSAVRRAKVDLLDQEKLQAARNTVIQVVGQETKFKDVFEKMVGFQQQLQGLESYYNALDQLGWDKIKADTVGDLKAIVDESPTLQTPEVLALFEGHDPQSDAYNINLSDIHKIKNTVFEKKRALRDQNINLRDQIRHDHHSVQFAERTMVDSVQEMLSDHKISIERVEDLYKYLDEAPAAKVKAALDDLWGHISTEQAVYNLVLQDGHLKALSPTGDKNINEGMLAYTSYSAYYRRNEHFYNYGFILDMEKILNEIPNVTGTVHVRNVWRERADLNNPDEIREAMEAWHDPGDEDIVIEVRMPQNVSINDYLIGVIEDGEVYVKSEYNTDNEGELSDYAAERDVDSASVIVNPRQDTEMSFEGQDSLKNKGAKEAVQFFSQIDEELGKRVGNWIPAMRKGWNDTMAVFESGRRGLEKLRSKPGAKATPFEAASNDLDLAMIDAVTRISGIRNITNPVLKERKALITQLSKAEGISRSQLTSDINEAISDYREHNKPIENNANLRAYEDDDLMAQVKEYADKEKEAWKQIIRQSDEDIITLVKAADKNNEKLTYPNGEPITPLPIDGFHYDLERDGWVQMSKWNAKQGRMRPATETDMQRTWTTAEVFAQAERFYVPHHYTKEHLLTRKDRVNKLLEELNYADATNDVSDIDDMVGIQHEGEKYIFRHTGEDFTAVEAVIQRAKEYWNNEDASVRQYINAHDDGTLARFGHLEHQRKTDDRHYVKDIEVHIKMIEQATRRMSLIAYFGQDHGIIGKSPRFKARMMQMSRYSHTPEEAALLAMYTAMGADKIGMFEHLYDLGSGTPKQDFDILGRWKDKETGDLKDLDIDRLELSDNQLETLRKIGLLEKDGNENWRVVGSSVKARHQTMQRHFADYSSTIAGRLKHFMNTLNSTADGPIRSLTDNKTNKLVSKVNSATTMLTLGPRTALQNLSELPNIIAAAGMSNFIKGLKFISNPDSRHLVKMLSSALDHGHRYMAETKGEQWYLQSPLSFFTQSELLSRESGVAIGWVNAKDRIQAYLNNPSQANRHALDDVKINKNVIDAFKTEASEAVDLEDLFTEAEQRVLHGSMPVGGFQKVGASSASNKWVDIIGQELQRSAVYMSQDFLKRYDAFSMPPWLAERHPFVNLFFKYRSWGFQNHELLARRWRQAWRQGKEGNWTPFLNMSLAAGVLTPLGIGALGYAFTVFQALDDDDPFALEILKTFTAAQSFGMASILIEAVAHAGDNPFRLEHSLRGQYSGPALSIATRILAPVFTGDFKEVFEQLSRRLPISREAHYLGLNKIFDEE